MTEMVHAAHAELEWEEPESPPSQARGCEFGWAPLEWDGKAG